MGRDSRHSSPTSPTYTLEVGSIFLQSAQGQDVVLDVLDYGSSTGQWLAVGLPRKQVPAP